jgi:hypothetical protein
MVDIYMQGGGGGVVEADRHYLAKIGPVTAQLRRLEIAAKDCLGALLSGPPRQLIDVGRAGTDLSRSAEAIPLPSGGDLRSDARIIHK